MKFPSPKARVFHDQIPLRSTFLQRPSSAKFFAKTRPLRDHVLLWNLPLQSDAGSSWRKQTSLPPCITMFPLVCIPPPCACHSVCCSFMLIFPLCVSLHVYVSPYVWSFVCISPLHVCPSMWMSPPCVSPTMCVEKG